MSINFVFKSTNGLMRCDWFCGYENVYNTRSTGQRSLNVPFVRSNQYMRSIRTAGPELWNTLPFDLKTCNSYASKYKLNSHLCGRASEQAD